MTGESNEELSARLEGQIDKLVTEELKDLVQTITGPGDPVAGVTLRFHLLTEHYLDRLISAKLPRGARFLKNRQSTYAVKLTLVHALEVLPDHIIAAIRALNKLRNEMSHKRNFVVTTAAIETIGVNLGQPFRDLRNNSNVSSAQKVAVLTYALLAQPLITQVIAAENVPAMQDEIDQAKSKK